MPARAKRPRGPRGPEAHTRDDIVAAALDLFSTQGYEKTSLRAIARAAGVDAALPRHYFASKSELFLASVGPLDVIDENVARILDGPVDAIGFRILFTFARLWDDPEMGRRLLTVVRNAMTVPEVADVARNLLFDRLFLRFARSVGDDDVEGRAGAAMTLALGLATSRYVLRVEPIASIPSEAFVARFAPAMQLLLTTTS